VTAVREWYTTFTKNSLTHDKFEIKFSKSSGPGGQNVNKVNTKVSLRFNLQDSKWLPILVRREFGILETNRINKRGEFIINSDRHRTQQQNIDDCIEKLYEILVRCADLVIPIDADPLKDRRIENLKIAAKAARKKDKDKFALKKSDRKRWK